MSHAAAPYFSLIVPVYKVERFLQDALDSVHEQTFTDYEALCVDDGSPDGSGTILDEAARVNPRFRVIHQRNAGVSAARNRALDRVRGSYVLFLDPDDAICPGWFAAFATVTKRHAPAMVAFGRTRFEENDDWRTLAHPCFDETSCRLFQDPIACAKELWPELRYNRVVWEMAWRADLIGDSRFQVGIRNGEDTVFHWDVFPRLTSMVVADYPGYYYRCRQGSAVYTFMPASVRARQHLLPIVHIIALTRALRGDPRRPFPILSYAPYIWQASIWRPLTMALRLRRDPEIHLDTPPRLCCCIQRLDRGKTDPARVAITLRLAFLYTLLALEWFRCLLCQALEKARNR